LSVFLPPLLAYTSPSHSEQAYQRDMPQPYVGRALSERNRISCESLPYNNKREDKVLEIGVTLGKPDLY
jgi:hypothetical protein